MLDKLGKCALPGAHLVEGAVEDDMREGEGVRLVVPLEARLGNPNKLSNPKKYGRTGTKIKQIPTFHLDALQVEKIPPRSLPLTVQFAPSLCPVPVAAAPLSVQPHPPLTGTCYRVRSPGDDKYERVPSHVIGHLRQLILAASIPRQHRESPER